MRRFLPALFLLGVSAPALADEWMEYRPLQVADPTGLYTVQTEPLAHAVPGGTGFSFRKGETVLAKGWLPSAPLEIRVSPEGRGFAAFEEYGGIGHGASLMWVDAKDGKVSSKGLHQIFSPEEIAGFCHTVSSIHYFRDAWIDDKAGCIVLVAAGPLLKVIDLGTGEVKPGGAGEVKRAMGIPSARVIAMDLAGEMSIDLGVKALESILKDAGSPLALRLRAAALLGPSSKDAQALFRRSAGPEGVSREDRIAVLTRLPAVLGEEAIPLLREALKNKDSGVWDAAQRGFAALGEKAIPVLLEILVEKGGSNDYRGGAAHALGYLGSPKALEGLRKSCGDPEEYVAQAAANAVRNIQEHNKTP